MVELTESESDASRALRLLGTAQTTNLTGRGVSEVMHMPAAVVLLQNPILSACLKDMNARLERLEQIFTRETEKDDK